MQCGEKKLVMLSNFWKWTTLFCSHCEKLSDFEIVTKKKKVI